MINAVNIGWALKVEACTVHMSVQNMLIACSLPAWKINNKLLRR